MTDREMLEYAAKAGGMTIDTHYVDGGASVWEGEKHNSDWIAEWNPLTDDGDALRLAVKLKIDMVQTYVICVGYTLNSNECAQLAEPVNDNPYAATRRAITRAAAEIGRNMK